MLKTATKEEFTEHTQLQALLIGQKIEMVPAFWIEPKVRKRPLLIRVNCGPREVGRIYQLPHNKLRYEIR